MTRPRGPLPASVCLPGVTSINDAAAINPVNLVAMNATSVTNTGGSQAHLNMQPFLSLNFCIALQGIFPSPN